MKQSEKKKPYWEMSLAELREATKEFDKPIPLSNTRPLTKAERARFDRARRGPVYSIHVHRGAKKKVTLCLDDWLLRRCDEYAKQHNMSRDEIIARSLYSSLAFAS